MFQKAFIGLIILLMPLISHATTDQGKPYKTITDADINASGYLFLSNDTNWVLDGFVYVEDGAVLEIEAGTVVKANPGQEGDASALIISRGGYLKAVGTPDAPIIFTSVRDTIDDIYDIDLFDPDSSRGLWGGLILLGRATISEPNGVDSIEGIPGDIQSRHFYGGGLTPNDNDSSCNLQYVSVRHGGTDIGEANEINGVTMGALGCKSIISHVEVIFNNDDGFEFFGGCPNTDHLAVAFCKDDSYDYDQGFRGTGQFWFTLHAEDAGDHGGEHDGGDDSPGLLPYATPVISNVTYLGRGVNAATSTYTMILRDNAGGAYYNSIFADWSGHGVTLDVAHSPSDSKDRMTNLGTVADLKIYNNYWADMGSGSDEVALCHGDVQVKAYLFGGEAG
ncbi:MAG: T9SS C-terminal target domain-containing protein, partial [bacterium]